MNKRRYCAVLVLLTSFACVLAGSAGARPLATPTITGFSPEHGLVGQKVTISGLNLTGAQVVQFNGIAATNAVVDPAGTSITVSVPPEVNTGAGFITVTTAGGTGTSSTLFTVSTGSIGTRTGTNPRPLVVAVTPSSGKVGAKVTITGKNMGGLLWVEFDGAKAAYTVPSTTKIVATVPMNAHSGLITVGNADGASTNLAHFRFTVTT